MIYQLVMSVPLHKDREFSRGYNQAYLISKELSRTIKTKGVFRRYRKESANADTEPS